MKMVPWEKFPVSEEVTTTATEVLKSILIHELQDTYFQQLYRR